MERYVENGLPIQTEFTRCEVCGELTQERVPWLVLPPLADWYDNTQLVRKMIPCDAEKDGYKTIHRYCACERAKYGIQVRPTEHIRNMRKSAEIAEKLEKIPVRYRDSAVENSDGRDKKLDQIVAKYCSKLDEMLAQNCGLCLYGASGAGKTWAVGTIAAYAAREKLIDVRWISTLGGEYDLYQDAKYDRNGIKSEAYWREMLEARLIVIDNVGAEEMRGDADKVHAFAGELASKLFDAKKLCLITSEKALDPAKDPLARLVTYQIPLSGNIETHRRMMT
ncbi:MAG: ATP-binding protein [Firmicutes bacterium]|nr:ATP-binding protein [Bacillota bacterium]